MAEAVWGEGFLLPGGAAWAEATAKVLGLAAGHSVLDLNAGLGGAARQIATGTGATVTGLVGDSLLARLGNDRCLAAGLGERASVAVFDPERFRLDRRHDAMFVHEGLFAVLRKDEAFGALGAGLKSHGALLMTDYVMTHSSGGGRVIGAWRSGEPQVPRPWTIAQTVERLKRLGFELQAAQDISAAYRREVLSAWSRFAATLRQRKGAPLARDAVIAEGELWTRRIDALDTGDLRLYRFHAIGPKVEDDED